MRIALVAGESSGDLLGAGLIKAIRERVPDATFEGVAGPAMIEAGCDPIADAEMLAVMGLVEPLKRVPALLKLRGSLFERWSRQPPDVFVGIDAPDFNFALEKKVRASGVATVHYVSPSIWAWRAGRIETVRAACDRILCILPFEKSLYDDADIDAVFVGHPMAERLPMNPDAAAYREQLGIEGQPVVALLPGSRGSEVSRLGPTFAEVATRLADDFANIRFLVPAATPRLKVLIENQLISAGVIDQVTVLDGQSIAAMAAADVVLLASGTAALESALLRRPTIAAYRVSPVTHFIVRRLGMLKIDHFTLPNQLTESPLVPEFMQKNATAERIYPAVRDLLNDPERCEAIACQFDKLRQELALGADSRAAEAVLDVAQKD
ncbi:MAG: lipid-A-disaccharide synthase [Pseudomonadota bacterium]